MTKKELIQNSKTSIKPRWNRVLIKVELQDKTEHGILVNANSDKIIYETGIIESVSFLAWFLFSVGDRVAFKSYNLDTIEIDGEDKHFISMFDIISNV